MAVNKAEKKKKIPALMELASLLGEDKINRIKFKYL